MPIGNAISGVFGTINANKSIAAQKEENQKTREYNLSLAKLQNQWNIDQWQRENQYNTPAAQMARFKAAGLNPDLIYGQSNTGGQISGSLTSGAPANPADIGSLLSQKGNNISKAYGALGDAMMELPMYREELRAKRLDNDLKQQQLFNSDLDSAFNAFISNSSFNPQDLETALKGKLTPRQRRYLMDLWKTSKDIENVDEDTKAKALDNRIKDASFDSLVSKIETEAKISNSNARYLAATFLARVSQTQNSAELSKLQKEYQANKNEWMDFDRFAPIVLQSADILGDFINVKNLLKNIIGNKKSTFTNMRKTGENTYTWD